MLRPLLLALLLGGATAAENLVLENSSFETGAWGFDAVPYAWVRAWPQVVQPQVVDDTAAHGRVICNYRSTAGYGLLLLR